LQIKSFTSHNDRINRARASSIQVYGKEQS
jgi:hypothetical protein